MSMKKLIKRMCVYVRAGGNESSRLELSFASKSTTQFLELPAEKSSLPTMVSMAMQSVFSRSVTLQTIGSAEIYAYVSSTVQT